MSRRMLAHPGQHVAPGDVGQAEVEHDQVGLQLVHERDRRDAGAGLPDDVEAAAEAERGAHQPACLGHVVDEQHPHSRDDRLGVTTGYRSPAVGRDDHERAGRRVGTTASPPWARASSRTM